MQKTTMILHVTMAVLLIVLSGGASFAGVEHPRWAIQATPAAQPIPPPAPLVGYRLPWASGQTGTVTQIDTAATDHLSQVDFLLADPGGDVYAAKPGTVVFVKQGSIANFQIRPDLSDCWRKANAIVIQHGPEEFSWYVHIAYRSATVSVGQEVGYGARIARQGDTGYTCNADCSGPGAHLHFMVSRHHDIGRRCDGFGCWPDQNDPDDLPWALDIVAVDFDEVSRSEMRAGEPYVSRNAP
jgi:hypothetical protein